MKKKFKSGDRVSFTGFDSKGIVNYKAFYTLTNTPDEEGFVKGFHGSIGIDDDEPVTIHILGCKRLVKKVK